MDVKAKASRSCLAIQLITVPVGACLSALLNQLTLVLFQRLHPQYPRLHTMGIWGNPPDHLHFLHNLGPVGILVIAALATGAVAALTFRAKPTLADRLNVFLVSASNLFLLASLASYTLGALQLIGPIR
jgi:hypothetical protein